MIHLKIENRSILFNCDSSLTSQKCNTNNAIEYRIEQYNQINPKVPVNTCTNENCTIDKEYCVVLQPQYIPVFIIHFANILNTDQSAPTKSKYNTLFEPLKIDVIRLKFDLRSSYLFINVLSMCKYIEGTSVNLITLWISNAVPLI